MRVRLLAVVLGITGATSACGSMSDASFAENGRAGDPGGGASNEPNAPGADGAPPREKEVESDYEAPVATGNFVWIANPKSGRVALVDVRTLQVRTVEAGNAPTYVSTVPAQADDTTLVLNVLSEDATLLKATKQGITTKTFETARLVNSVAFSADGRYAIAWADSRKAATAPRAEGFQDLTVLDLVEGKSFTLAVGYRPVAITISGSPLRAQAVTQDGVAVIDLLATAGTPATWAPKVLKNVAISDTPTEDPGSRDVFVTRDGKSAYVRRDESPDITIVDLETDARTKVTLAGNVTDLDLADTGDRAIAVARDVAQVAVLPIAAPQTFTSTTITGETVGSVAISPGGSRALLYTNVTAAERFTILDVAPTLSFRVVRLYSPVLGVFSSPDAQHAVVLHDKTDGQNGSVGAFSVVPIGQNLPAKIVPTGAPLVGVAVTNDRAVIAERGAPQGSPIYGAYIARMPSLMVERYALASPPIAVGVVESAKRAFVSQLHPEGRMTFIDLETGVARTLTGFELSSRVVDGSKP